MRTNSQWITAATLVAALTLGGGASAQEFSWLPGPVAEGAAQQLADRMKLLPELFDGEVPELEKVLGGSRRMIGEMASVVGDWGFDGVLAQTPEFSQIAIEPTGDRYLDAMGHYQVCTMLLYLQLQDPAYNADLNIRMTSVFGLSGLALATVSLREPFVAGGGDPAAIEGHLSGPALEPAFKAIQGDPAIRGQTEAECGPVVVELIDRPLQILRGEAEGS